MKEKFVRFMQGRYGADALARFMMWITLALIVVEVFVKNQILTVAVMVLIVISYYRMFSKNIQKRYEENRKFLALQSKVTGRFTGMKKDMEQRKVYHIYKCPNCKQKIRIPKGKGKISITCPKCHTEFVKKS